MESEVLKQQTPASADEDQMISGPTVYFLLTGDELTTASNSVSSNGAPVDVRDLAPGIVHDFGEALDRLAE